MFFLKELPDQKTLEVFAKQYSVMQTDTTAACLRLLKIASNLMRDLEIHFSKYELSLARFLALIILEREPSKSLLSVEIANKMGVSKKNTARLLIYLEDSQLVKRANHETDGRASVVTITAKGSDLIKSVMPGYYEIMNHVMRPLDKKSKSILIQLLNKIDHH